MAILRFNFFYIVLNYSLIFKCEDKSFFSNLKKN